MVDSFISETKKKTGPTNIEKKRKILSEKVSYKNADGLNIVGYFDHQGEWQKLPFVIVSPAYGETKKDYISLSYYLVSNGFNVIRYDSTCHLGESDGNIINADLLRMQDDLLSTVNFIENSYFRKTVSVVATSLSGRVAIRLAVSESRIISLSVLVGIINLRGTFESIYREDIIGEYKHGKCSDTLDIFGHEVKAIFIKNAIDNMLDDFNGTLTDIKQIRCPVTLLSAENDAWINLSEARRLLGVARHPKSELRVISGALHQLQENPRLAKLAIEQVVQSCKDHLEGNIELNGIVSPDIHEIVDQNKIERELLRQRSKIYQGAEKRFWEAYLSEFSIAFKLPDYMALLELSEDLLDCFAGGSKILDAGCGNGHFGVWILKKAVERLIEDRSAAINLDYVGLDFAEKAVVEARKRHTEILNQLTKMDSYKKGGGSKFKYVVADLDNGLPFPDEYFNKICCNLVISYVMKPISVIEQFKRVLKKNGTIVVTSLKPYCDLSLIYKHFTETTYDRKDLEEAVALLSNTGKIRQKESEGHYQFYSEDELQELICRAGLVAIKLIRSCGDQVNVAYCRKI